MKTEIPPYVILGCGYVGTRLAQSLLAEGARVRVCARRVALLEPLRELGADVHYMDGGRPHQFGPALLGLDRPVVVYCIPGIQDLPQGEAVRRAASAAHKVMARSFIYLGSSAVYGRSEAHLTSEWVDEDSSVATSDPDSGLRLHDEASIKAVGQAGLRTVILRLAAIYGPPLWSPQQGSTNLQGGRGVRQRLRTGQYKLWDGGNYYFSRIFIDDLVRIIRACGETATVTGTYVVGDDHPCPQGEYGRWLASHLGLPEPQLADSHQSSGPRQAIRGRRLRNTRLKQDLNLQLQYPTYREGELQIDAIEAGAPLPALRLYGADPTPVAATPVPAPSTPATVLAAPAPSEPVVSAAQPSPKVVAATPAAVKHPAQVEPPPEVLHFPTLQPQPPLVAWPRAHAGQDLGHLCGQQPLGAELLVLQAGQSAPPGRIYLVLAGHPRAHHGDPESAHSLSPLDLCPKDAQLHNPGFTEVTLLAFT
jgi:nucleoside-diphosphate-sugar epimerase